MPSFFSRLFGAGAPPDAPREAKYSRAAKMLAMHSIGMPQWTPRNYAALTREGYERNAVCHRAVRMIAEAAASVPWLMFQGREEIIEHPLLDLLERPNPCETGILFIESVCTNLLLFGDAYIEAAFIAGEPREIYSLRPDRMRVEPGRNGWPAAYIYSAMGDQIRYEIRGAGVEPILHIKLFNPLDDHYGFPPLAAAQVALDTHNAASFWNKALLDNSARPSGALVYAGPDGGRLTDEQFNRLREELEQNFSGSPNAGRPLLLEGGLDWKALSLSPKDMDFAETKSTAAREIALAFGVPPLLLGLPGDNTFRNYQEANRAFWRQTVIPLVARLQKSFQLWAQPAFESFRFDYNVDRIDALSTERAAEWRRIDAASFLTVDEKREAAGYGGLPKDQANSLGKRCLDAWDQRYSPDQPRVPAGSLGGGRWTTGGGGGGDASSGAPGDQYALNVDPNVASDASGLIEPTQQSDLVDLRDEEGGVHDGHTIRDHVGKSVAQLIRETEASRQRFGILGIWKDRIGAFPSLDAANKLVNSTLAQNPGIVADVAEGIEGGATIESWFKSPTGYESYAKSFHGQVDIRDTWGVRVVIKHDSRSTRGFRVFTAFPINVSE
jgi:HK97 family phage portal protein